MTYNEKRILYESIMKEISKAVRHHLNEGFESSVVGEFYNKIRKDAESDKDSIYYLILFAGGGILELCHFEEGSRTPHNKYGRKGFNYNNLPFGKLTDDDLDVKKIMDGSSLKGYIHANATLGEVAKESKKRYFACAVKLSVEEAKKRILKTENDVKCRPEDTPYMTLAFNEKGREKMDAALKTHNTRKEEKEKNKKGYYDTEHGKHFGYYREYEKYKKKYGEKLALKLTDDMNKFAKDENCQKFLQSLTSQKISNYLNRLTEIFIFMPGERNSDEYQYKALKNKDVQKIYMKYHPDVTEEDLKKYMEKAKAIYKY